MTARRLSFGLHRRTQLVASRLLQARLVDVEREGTRTRARYTVHSDRARRARFGIEHQQQSGTVLVVLGVADLGAHLTCGAGRLKGVEVDEKVGLAETIAVMHRPYFGHHLRARLLDGLPRVAVPLIEQATQAGVEIDEVVGDMAYGDGDTREAVEQTGAKMVAKVRPCLLYTS